MLKARDERVKALIEERKLPEHRAYAIATSAIEKERRAKVEPAKT